MEDYTFASVEVDTDGKHKRSFFGVFDGHSGKKAAIHAKVFARTPPQLLVPVSHNPLKFTTAAARFTSL